ncbi:GIY-YIG nuclease family protein [Planctomicrobium sp. SH661]|uniref:GIY-YIG nuclease family protein n=1 Tax=Planctomicrobium sp. SH661 TaxID=3448124 RepID=UPI003F5C393C
MKRKRMQITPVESLPDLFATSRYISVLAAAKTLPLSGSRPEIRSRLRENCPDLPGVYGMVSPTGQLIYVGMSRSLRKRLQSYFSSKVSRTKERRIGHRSMTLIWQPAAHELIARLRERELIRQYRPNYNVQGHPTRMKLGFLILLEQTAPAFTLLPHLPRKHGGAWGPLPLTKFLRQAVSELNHQFLLRDCPRETPMQFRGDAASTESQEFTPCMRADLGTCLAPCIGGCTKVAYSRSLNAARKFLNGTDRSVLEVLSQEMKASVELRRYEKAATLRDRLQSLERIDLHLRRFHDWTSQANFLYPVTSALDGREWWLVIARGAVVEVLPRPVERKDREVVRLHLKQLGAQFAGTPAQASVTGPDEFESARLLFRWFRLFPEEKDRQLSLAKACRLCQSNAPS